MEHGNQQRLASLPLVLLKNSLMGGQAASSSQKWPGC